MTTKPLQTFCRSPSLPTSAGNKLFWIPTNHGEFTVKLAYIFFFITISLHFLSVTKVWRLCFFIKTRIEVFVEAQNSWRLKLLLWKIAWDILPNGLFFVTGKDSYSHFLFLFLFFLHKIEMGWDLFFVLFLYKYPYLYIKKKKRKSNSAKRLSELF